MSNCGTPPSHAARTSPITSPAAAIAFLVHSPDTLQRNLPPDVDNKPLARQKRRRTSPEDQKILEEEYQRNPKPDKTARMNIVSRVCLGEKEVQASLAFVDDGVPPRMLTAEQIWFQNRRQNSRRKSKSSVSLEVIPSSGTEMPSSDAPNDYDHQLNPASDVEHAAGTASFRPPSASHDVGSQCEALPAIATSQQTASQDPNPESQTTATDSACCATDSRSAAVADPTSPQPLLSSQDTARSSSGLGYLANRRSASFAKSCEDGFPGAPNPEALASVPQTSSRPFGRTQSLRLSMTSDGKATVVDSAYQSPSPPKARAVPAAFYQRAAGLRRSLSASCSFGEKLRQAASQGRSPLPSTTAGRSRDSRTWEFWCDSETRNSLAEKASQEGSGSAADAIGLIRSNSGNVLKANPNKRNAPLYLHGSAKRARTDAKSDSGRRFSRSISSYGRLQGQDRCGRGGKEPAPLSDDKKRPDDVDAEVPVTESDKENWEPSENGTTTRRRPTRKEAGGQHHREILGENTQVISQSSSLGAMMAREKQQQQQQQPPPFQRGESTETDLSIPEDDEEVVRFMAGGKSGRTSVSSGEDLDCIQGLLKLSQGNWK